MSNKMQLHNQALWGSLIIVLSWFVFVAFMLIPIDTITFKYMIVEQAVTVIPVLILLTLYILLNYLLKPDLGKCFKLHMLFGFVTVFICVALLISFKFVLPMFGMESVYATLAIIHMNLYWIVPVVSLLTELVILIKQRMIHNAKEVTVLILSHAGICLLITYVVELLIIGSNI